MMLSKHIQQDIYITVDNVLFSLIQNKLHVLLLQRNYEPDEGKWALPGGFVHTDETLEDAAHRELQEETNVRNVYLEQLYTFSDLKRDPRARVISTVYMAIVHRKNLTIEAGAEAQNVDFHPIEKLPAIAFDHKKIISYALQRLQYKLEYTNVVQYFLPDQFPLTQLQSVYEIVLEKEFDVRNFRKKILSLGMIEETGERQVGVTHRPAKLYRFVSKDVHIYDVLSATQ